MEQPDVVPVDIRNKLGTDVICLRPHMNEPADVVVPIYETVPNNKLNADLLCAVNLLARGAIITLYNVAQLTQAEIRPLCDVVSRGAWSI